MITFARRLTTPAHELHQDDLCDLAATWGVPIEIDNCVDIAYCAVKGITYFAKLSEPGVSA